MLFASDVDSTLVYPARTQPTDQPTETAEIRSGRVLTCASVELAGSLRDLATCGVMLVPVTARSRAQLDALIQLRGARLAITGGGGHVWRDGHPLPEWDTELRNMLTGTAAMDQARHHLAARFTQTSWIIGEERVDDHFFFLIAPHGDLPADAEARARCVLADLGWTAYAHGRKLYCLPGVLRKETALTWLVDRLGESLVAAAGDSELDAQLLAMAPVAFCPRGSSLAASPLLPTHARISDTGCAAAGPEIVRAVAQLVRQAI